MLIKNQWLHLLLLMKLNQSNINNSNIFKGCIPQEANLKLDGLIKPYIGCLHSTTGDE